MTDTRSHADRQRRYRNRQKAGVAVFTVQVPEADLLEGLIRARLLDPEQAHDREAVRQGLERSIRLSVRR